MQELFQAQRATQSKLHLPWKQKLPDGPASQKSVPVLPIAEMHESRNEAGRYFEFENALSSSIDHGVWVMTSLRTSASQFDMFGICCHGISKFSLPCQSKCMKVDF